MIASRIKRLLAVAGVGALVTAGALIGVGGNAMAGTGPVTYTSTTLEHGNSVAGWSAFSASEVNFTHIESYIGSSGDSSWENLPVVTGGSSWTVGKTFTDLSPNGNIDPITGGVGLQLCDRNVGGSGNLGEAAQIGVVNVGGGNFDVVEALGAFNPFSLPNAALNSSGNVCDNGVLGSAPGSIALIVKVLLTGIRANDTVQAGILYDPHSHYTFGGRIVQKGYITFYATDLSNLGLTNQDFLGGGVVFAQDVPCRNSNDVEVTCHFNPLLTNEADAGVVSDTTLSPSISGTPVPAPNGGSLESAAPNELVRFAHTKASANSTVIGGHETAGAGAFYNVPAWTAYPVASTSDGTPAGMLKLDPQWFAADNFAVEGGLGLI